MNKITITITPDLNQQVYVVTCNCEGNAEPYLAESEGDAIGRAKEMLDAAALAAGVSHSELERWA